MSGKQFAIIVSITFIVGMIWLVTDIIFNTKPSISASPKLEILLQPVNPNFNPRVLEMIDTEVTDARAPQNTNPLQAATQSAKPNI